ncbi:MAG: fused MFS/spermidine synthase [Acidobacteriota bacterium]|nr:fused MFS/spermidine synthase [Acidobacteriota bacterium]
MVSRRAVFALFFFSGIAGLIYQVLWLRRLSVIFGVTVYAASTVLAAFMAGLAIGSLLAGRVLRRRIPALQAFGIAEILVGVTGLVSPLLLEAASSIYLMLHRAAPESLGVVTVARLLCSFAILVVPTAMMGMTLPLLSAAVANVLSELRPEPAKAEASRRAPASASIGSSVSLLYTVNTAGAMVGTLVTGFVLIPAIGIQRAFLIAAALNVIVGVTAIWMATRRSPGDQRAAKGSDPPSPKGFGEAGSERIAPDVGERSALALWIAVVVSGFASLGLEVLWFRLMLQFVIATTEAFTAMLATVLAGIAIGGGLASQILKSRARLPFWITIVQAGTGLATLASMAFLLWTVQNGWNTMLLWRAVTIAILPPAILMGVGFPLMLGMATQSIPAGAPAQVSDRIGHLYALNVFGAIAGSLAAGFVLLPWIGAMSSLVVLAALYLASALIMALSGPAEGRGWWVARRLALATVAAIAVAFGLIGDRMPDPFKVAIDRRYGDLLLEFWRDEGAQTAVSVRASRFQHVLYLDGLHQANDQFGMVRLHRAIGHLPMVLHGSASDVLVVGLGGGATPGAISQHKDVRVQVVELSTSVVGAAPFFAHVNYDLLNQTNVDLRIDDGRNFLTFTDRRFDVITADIIQPEHAGAGHVYSREYFALVRRALKDGGIALQWIGHRPSVEYKLIMRTFLDVFPQATLWYDGQFMVGTRQPLSIDPASLDRLRSDPATRDALDAIGLTGFDVLRSWYTAGADEMRAFVGAGPVLTDDRPLVEYSHWLPDEQPPLDLASLKGDVSRITSTVPRGGR